MTASHPLPRCIGALLLIAGLASVGQAETLYVDGRNGSDMNPGTEATPVQTLERAATLVDRSRAPGPTTVIVAPGLYCLQQCVTFGDNRAFTEADRLTIRAAVLPDDLPWRPERMPIIVSAENPKGSAGLTETYSLKIQTSHVTIQGVKFLGNPLPRNWHCCIERIGDKLDDLVVTQCLFVADADTSDIYCAALATGNRFIVDHCVFSGCHACTVFWDGPEGGGKGCAMRYCIVDNALIAGVWTCQTGEDFEFHHNIVARSEYLWMRKQGDRQTYRIADCALIETKYVSGYGTASGPTGQTGEEVRFENINVLTRGTVSIETAKTARDYMHITEGSTGYNLGAGLFRTSDKQGKL